MINNTIKVAVLTTSFPIDAKSISGVFVRQLVENLPTTIKSTVITPCGTSVSHFTKKYTLRCFRYAPWKWQILAHKPGGIPVALKNSKISRFFLPVFLVAMFIACFRTSIKSDIIHANWSVNGAIAGLVGLLLNKPVITTLRGEDATRAEQSKLYFLFLSICLRLNYKMVAVSEAIHALLCHQFPKYHDKIIFIPNGVDSKLLARPFTKTRANKTSSLKLLTIGSLIPRKGIDILVNALGLLSDTISFTLTIVGEGSEFERLKKQVNDKHLQESVIFSGSIQTNEIADYLSNADIFILSSYSEGRPNVVLESFAAGVPVIASNIPGVQELIKDQESGLLFNPGDAEDLASCIMQLKQNNNLLSQYAIKGRNFILENNLLWPQTGHRYAQLYYQAINHKKGVCAE